MEKRKEIKSMAGSGSQPIHNVQALAAVINCSTNKYNDTIPERYIRHEAQSDLVVNNENLEIPIIDMERLVDPQFSSQELNKLHLACQEWCFFQLINHNIDNEIMEKMKSNVLEFFDLPLEEKKVYSTLPGNIEGYGQLFVMSDDQKLDWVDNLYFGTLPLTRRNTVLWPANIRDSLEKYTYEVNLLANTLLAFMAKNLGVKIETMEDMFNDGTQSVRINYYPPCPKPENALGFSPHTDGSAITFVLQVNDVQGLQICKEGQWITVKAVPGAFIVNIGDLLQIQSNGIYRSVEHRAIVNKEKERVSIATFHSANPSSMIGPFQDIAKSVNEAKYKTMSGEEYMKLFFATKPFGKSLLDSMKK